LSFDNFEYIDLKGRSLRTVPVVLHTKADSIISLNLSCNPILEIPLDFVQSCTTLRELRLSNMAMKKVPQSVRHSATLRRLDLSCNRIVDLDEAGLDRITDLTTLSLQNNRMEKLPWYFPRLRSLKHLNISNNKFRKLPSVVTDMVKLVDLDISFNTISELPEQIGNLKSLETFIIVGNQVSRFPDECRGLVSLNVLDCRRNHITDLSVVCTLPNLVKLCADHNAVHALDLSLGPNLRTLDASYSDITHLSLVASPAGPSLYALTSLDVSHAKLSSLDDLVLAQLSSLQSLKLDYNSFRFIPESLGELSNLITLSCSDNQLGALPATIGRLQNLQTLDVHNNSLSELPESLWNCGSLAHINVTSNLLGTWHDPPVAVTSSQASTSISSSRAVPPLAQSLERLYLGENRVTDEVLHPLMIFKELRVLNLSFNDIQDMPPTFFKNLTKLEELYLSGNKLAGIPTEYLHRLEKLSVLFLNGNRLRTLPHELGKVQSLTVLDVGSNLLKYNINNLEFDWNW
jgi:adenylate cyclase